MFFKENKKIILQAIFGLLFIGLAYFFIRYQRAELVRVRLILGNARIYWLFAGLFLAFIFIALQGFMYAKSFGTVNAKVSYFMALKVFLKRNFIGVFLPAGGVASLGFFTRDFERKYIPLTKIYFGSSIYVVTGIISLILVSMPVLFWTMIRRGMVSNQLYPFLSLCLVVGLLLFLFISISRKGIVYRILIRVWPSLEKYLSELRSISIRKFSYALTLSASLTIELVGAVLLMISMKALGFNASFEVAIVGYITSMIFQMISPFMKGLGAIELSMSFVLTRYGYSTVDAISVTLLYRFFAFWFPLLISGLSFGFIRNNLLLRIVPALLSFLLGIINIIAVLTPPAPDSLAILKNFMPRYVFDASGYFLMITGLLLLVNTAFLLKGLKTAWYIGLLTGSVSLAGHLATALNYQQAIVAALFIFGLAFTRKQYFVRSNPRFGQISISTGLISVLAVITYGIIGFYFLDERFFKIDFTFLQSVSYTLQNFFLFRDAVHLNPVNNFARDFVSTIKVAGFLSIAFLFYTLIRPLLVRFNPHEGFRLQARESIKKFGKSGFDYFKTTPDKFLFFLPDKETFLSYRVAGNYAMVLEDPVAPDIDEMKKCISLFDDFCFNNGLKPFYYLVPEESLPVYDELMKKYFLPAQEAIVDLRSFTPEEISGTILHANKFFTNLGYYGKLYSPPISDDKLHLLKQVSDQWLEHPEHNEAVFAEGNFNKNELREHEIITIENSTGRIAAFLDIIPGRDGVHTRINLIRKVNEYSDGLLDYLVLEAMKCLKSRGIQYLDLGFAPMPDPARSQEFREMSLRFAYEKILTFTHYHGWREFREKFNPQWQNRYVVYDHHYDLFNLPSALKKVMKP